MEYSSIFGYVPIDLGPGEVHECCGELVPAHGVSASTSEPDQKPEFWQCNGCGKFMGFVRSKFPQQSERWLYADFY